jgi:c-di-GMP-binding flagellar brake protein YcgR
MKERRLATRIKTLIEVYYEELFKTDTLGKAQKATIVDLSLGGCSLLVSKKDTFNINSKIKLSFMLDDDKRTKIERVASVCGVRGNYISCIFVPQIHGSEPDFISYINAHQLQNTGEK